MESGFHPMIRMDALLKGVFRDGYFRKYLYVAVFVKKVGVDYVGCD